MPAILARRSSPVPTTPKTLLITSRFRVEEVEQPLPGGGTRKRQIVRHPGAVTILPLVSGDQVCLIRNYRIAVGQTLIELPAGTLEPGEDPAHTAERELIEETGYRATHIGHLHSFFLSPGILDERMHLYVATGLELVGAAREAGEDIENLVVPWAQAMDMIFQGEIQDAKSIIGLLYYDQLLSRQRRISEG
jgi:ADP-ribose pyrophosphatase